MKKLLAVALLSASSLMLSSPASANSGWDDTAQSRTKSLYELQATYLQRKKTENPELWGHRSYSRSYHYGDNVSNYNDEVFQTWMNTIANQLNADVSAGDNTSVDLDLSGNNSGDQSTNGEITHVDAPSDDAIPSGTAPDDDEVN